MTQQYTQSKNRFYVQNAYAEFEDLEEDDPEINKIVVDLIGTSDELHMYPRTEADIEQTVNGVQGKEPKEVPYRTTNLPEKFKKLIQSAGDTADSQTIVIDGTVQVNEYDDGNVVYRMWSNMIESDSFNLDVVTDADASDNPFDLSKLENQQRSEELLDDEDSEEEKSEEEDDVLFGEEDE